MTVTMAAVCTCTSGLLSYLPLIRASELFLLRGFEELIQADQAVVIQVYLQGQQK